MQTKSPARNEVIAFLKKTKMDENYEFIYRGTPLEAEDFVKRMRTELSRLRNLVRGCGRPLSRFKVLLVSVKEITASPPRTKVVLKKALNGQKDISEYLDAAIVAELVNGETGE